MSSLSIKCGAPGVRCQHGPAIANQAPHRHRQAKSGTYRRREPPHARHTCPGQPTQVRHRRRGHQESAAPGLPTAAAAPRTASVRLPPSRAENAPQSRGGTFDQPPRERPARTSCRLAAPYRSGPSRGWIKVKPRQDATSSGQLVMERTILRGGWGYYQPAESRVPDSVWSDGSAGTSGNAQRRMLNVAQSSWAAWNVAGTGSLHEALLNAKLRCHGLPMPSDLTRR